MFGIVLLSTAVNVVISLSCQTSVCMQWSHGSMCYTRLTKLVGCKDSLTHTCTCTLCCQYLYFVAKNDKHASYPGNTHHQFDHYTLSIPHQNMQEFLDMYSTRQHVHYKHKFLLFYTYTRRLSRPYMRQLLSLVTRQHDRLWVLRMKYRMPHCTSCLRIDRPSISKRLAECSMQYFMRNTHRRSCCLVASDKVVLCMVYLRTTNNVNFLYCGVHRQGVSQHWTNLGHQIY